MNHLRISWCAPGRPARKWLKVTSDDAGRRADEDDIVAPDTTVIITDQPAVRKASRDFTILAN